MRCAKDHDKLPVGLINSLRELEIHVAAYDGAGYIRALNCKECSFSQDKVDTRSFVSSWPLSKVII